VRDRKTCKTSSCPRCGHPYWVAFPLEGEELESGVNTTCQNEGGQE